MILTDAYIFQGDRGFIRGSIEIKGNVIGDIIPDSQETDGSVSLHGDLVLPGLVDIHTHGSVGHCFSDGSYEGLVSIGKYMASHGVTTFLPTSMTLPHEELKKAFETAVLYKENRPKDGAKAGGIHMEGPYLSEGRKGSQNGSYLRLPDLDGFLELSNGCGGMIRIVDVAPELKGAAEFIRKASSVCKVSVAHTEADYEEAKLAFGYGASHVTHLFNGMSAAHHRQPGVVGAAFDSRDVTVELICDGVHVHPSMIRMAFGLFPGRVCLVSDSLRCCGMPDGVYEHAGQKIKLEKGQARTTDGDLAGAAMNLYDDMVNAIRFGIDAEKAIAAATLTPAKAVGMDSEIGSIETGKRADLIVCGRDWKLKQVYVEGCLCGPLTWGKKEILL